MTLAVEAFLKKSEIWVKCSGCAALKGHVAGICFDSTQKQIVLELNEFTFLLFSLKCLVLVIQIVSQLEEVGCRDEFSVSAGMCPSELQAASERQRSCDDHVKWSSLCFPSPVGAAMWQRLQICCTLFTLYSAAPPAHINRLALFPDKSAWCEAKNITQIVGHTGCQPRSIQNRSGWRPSLSVQLEKWRVQASKARSIHLLGLTGRSTPSNFPQERNKTKTLIQRAANLLCYHDFYRDWHPPERRGKTINLISTFDPNCSFNKFQINHFCPENIRSET